MSIPQKKNHGNEHETGPLCQGFGLSSENTGNQMLSIKCAILWSGIVDAKSRANETVKTVVEVPNCVEKGTQKECR